MNKKNSYISILLLLFNTSAFGQEKSSPTTTALFLLSGLSLVAGDMYLKNQERQRRQQIWTDFNREITTRLQERTEKLETELKVAQNNKRSLITDFDKNPKKSINLFPLAVLDSDEKLFEKALKTDSDYYVYKNGQTIIDAIADSARLTRQQKQNWLRRTRQRYGSSNLDNQLKNMVLHNKPIEQKLLSYGADPDKTDKNGNSLLCISVRKAHPRNVKLLLQYGANVKSKDSYGNTAMQILSKKLQQKNITDRLIDCLEGLLEYDVPSKGINSSTNHLYRFKPVSVDDTDTRKRVWHAIVSSVMKREEKCFICDTVYQDVTTVHVFGCFHDFCVDCARKVDKCPLCRYPKEQRELLADFQYEKLQVEKQIKRELSTYQQMLFASNLRKLQEQKTRLENELSQQLVLINNFFR